MTKKKATNKAIAKKDAPVKLSMGFEDAMKKALNTPLLKKDSKIKKSR